MTVLDFERRRGRPSQDLTNYDDDEMRVPEFTLGDRMQKAMDLAGLGVGDMAELCGVSRQTVSRWINGKGEPKRLVRDFWATGCGVDLQWLETGVPSETARALQVMRAERGDSKTRRYPLGANCGRALSPVNHPLTANRRGPILRVVAS